MKTPHTYSFIPNPFIHSANVYCASSKCWANAGDKRLGFHPWAGKIPWRRAWQPTPVFLPGESHGQRNLEGYSP